MIVDCWSTKGCAMARSLLDLYPEKIRLRSRLNRFPGVNGACWEWIGQRCDADYGIAFLHGRRIGAHRLSWLVTHGSVPRGYEVCHKCDVHCCCNPDHLFVALPEQNQLDRWKWSFVKRGKFVAGDYEEWRKIYLFSKSWFEPEKVQWQTPFIKQISSKGLGWQYHPRKYRRRNRRSRRLKDRSFSSTVPVAET